MSLAYGMDLSAYQPKVDWPKVKGDNGLSFVMVKASEGTWPDRLFAQHWAGAKSAGLLRGAYHFFRQAVDAHQQAQAFLSALGGDPGELPPVLDIEDPNVTAQAPLAEAAQAWLQEVEAQLGRKPIVYTGAWWWDPNMLSAGGYPAWAADHPLWVAYFPLRQGVPSAAQIEQAQFSPRLPRSWTRWSFWQYTGDAALLEGIEDERGRPARVDLDVFNGTEAELRAMGTSMPAAVTPGASE